MDRRTLLKTLATGALACASGQLFAAPAGSSRCLLVFLRGAYDAANLLIPISSDFYYAARPGIAIPRPGPGADTALPLTADWGLHPALRESIQPLYQKGQAIFLPFAGTDDTSRSHFETQDSIELGQGAGIIHSDHSGFLARLATQLRGAAPIAFTDQLPLILRGPQEIPNIALRSTSKPGIDARQSSLIASMYHNTPLAENVDQAFAVRDAAQASMLSLEAEMKQASRNAITPKGFAAEAQRIARMMKDQYTLGFVDVGGWDTHVAQGGATGALASRLGELGQGLATYANEMGDAWRSTVVVVISEFGRTFRENGNHGTDHGHGTVYWILGGGLHARGIIGEQQAVTEKTLFQNRDYPVLNEYRSVLGGLFARLYGLDNRRLEKIFPNVKAQDLGIV
jgi:uncharacterized protein (DUF1501 family)